MRIALAYPFDGHKPDDVIEVADDLGRGLIRGGMARPADRRKLTTESRRTRPAEPAPPTTTAHEEEAD